MCKPTLHSHTHCQAAQAHATTQAWQRVWLSNRTTKTTDKPTDEEEHRTDNSGFAKWRVMCYYDSLVQGSSSVFQLKFCAENPPLRKAENRWIIPSMTSGFYLVAHVFSIPENATSFITYLEAQGFKPGYFVNPKNGYYYVFIAGYPDLTTAQKALNSKFNGLYTDEMWILEIKNP